MKPLFLGIPSPLADWSRSESSAQPSPGCARPWGLAVAVSAVIAATMIAQPVASTPPAAKRPNIVWFIAENIAHDLTCFGAKDVHTPHADRLAAEGVRYTNVFATSATCAPSRSAFFTGMYQTTTDTHNMRSHRNDDYRLPAGVRPITHRLRDAGYLTANIKTIGDQTVGTGKIDLNFVNEGVIYQSDEWSALLSNRPFFAVINAPEAEYDVYDRQSWKKSRVEWAGEPEHVQYAKPESVTPPPYYPDHPVVRQEWARFLNSVSNMDRRLGVVLEALRASGMEDDTIVIYFADNGRLEPNGIHWCTDSGLRVPMIIKWPKNFPAPPQSSPGTVNAQVISLLDLTATTLQLAGVPRPLGMQSRLFLGEHADAPRQYAFGARDRIDETVHRVRSVHDERYHYVRTFTPGLTFASLNRYKEKCFLIMPLMRELQAAGKLSGPPAELMLRHGPAEQLFDTKADPYEIDDLIDSARPEHREALARLRSALTTWIAETGDCGQRAEPAEVVAPFEKEMDDWFGTPAWVRKKSAP